MNSPTQLINAFKTHIGTLYPQIAVPFEVAFNIDPQRQQFGDLSCNVAMVYAKLIGDAPRAIALNIINSFSHAYVQKIDIAGPGFINLTLKPIVFAHLLTELQESGDQFFKPEEDVHVKKYNIEFVSANPTGPLHLGHGRGGIIGDVLGTTLQFLGYPTTKEFYINDAGNQIEKLGNSFKIRCLQQLGEPVALPEDGYHGQYLQELAAQAHAELGDALSAQPCTFYATYAKEYLLQKIKETLAAYGINFDVWFSEKSLHDAGAVSRGLERLAKNGYLYEQEDALWLRSTAFGDDKDRVLKKASGELTYVAADVAYLENKIERGFDKLIMILGQDHHSYVVRLKAVLQALGRDPAMLDVILYQLVTIKEDGQQVRLSKRAGKIVSLEDVIESVGKDVTRFFYLNRKADAHLEFDMALALSHTEENPVYYIQYAYVRTLSLLEKAAAVGLNDVSSADAAQLTEKEQLLIKKVVSLKKLLEDISTHYQTHLLAYYVHDLAHIFSTYYGSTKVIDMTHVPITRARLLLIRQLRDTFNLCLRLLSISTPTKM